MAKTSHSDLLDKLKLAAGARKPFETDWNLNLSYLAGDQHVYPSTDGVVQALPLLDGVTRVTRNHMLKIHRIERAKILKNAPTPIAMPVSESMDDLVTARIASAWFRQLQEEWRFDRRLRSAVSWALATGNGFLKWWWDSAQKLPRCTVTPPFELFFDPYATNTMDARWVIHSQFMAEDMALSLYGSKNAPSLRVSKTGSRYPTASVSDGLQADSDRRSLDGVTVHEFWQPPNPMDRDGAFVAFTEDGILYESEFPYAHARIPFTQIGHIERTGSMWYRSGMDALRSLQDELNRTEAQIVENRNLSQGKWWVPSEVQLEDMPNAEPRQILTGSSAQLGMKPEFIPINSMPAWVGGEPDRLANAMSDLIGQHEVSNAGVPGRVEAASAIQLLQEVDDSVLQDIRESLNEAVADGFMMALGYLKQFGDPRTAVKVYDKSGMLELQELKTDKLDPDMRVVARTTSGLSNSVAGRWQQVTDLKRYGILEDNTVALEMLDLPTDQFNLLSDQEDRNKAWRENRRVQKARSVDELAHVRAGIYDNHAAHRSQHYKFMKTPEYDAMTPDQQQFMVFHCEQHDAWEKVLLGREAQKQLIAAGQMQAPMPGDVIGATPETGDGPSDDGVSQQLGQQQQAGMPTPGGVPGQAPPEQPPDPQGQPQVSRQQVPLP